jgi:predicted chitinase
VTKAVNGGYNGLDDRIDYLVRAKAVLGMTSGIPV